MNEHAAGTMSSKDGVQRFTNPPWWQQTTIYQVYPRSFMDSNGDGIGDLAGILSRLDYIQALGFETIWFSPFFDSPQKDFGYDVRNYTDAAPEYGTQDDILRLIEAVHERGMRIVFDLVLNHTSDEHPWFVASRSSRDNPRRDWYIWREGKSDKPPNNWKAMIGGSGWQYDERTSQWYFATFLPFQPDLNWRNPEVKAAMLDVVRFWLDKGVDGFRLDIFGSIYKDEQFRDNPFSWKPVDKDMTAGFFQKWTHTLNLDETIEFARELREVLDHYQPDRFLLGEVFAAEETVKSYLGNKKDGLNLIFAWDLINAHVDGQTVKQIVAKYERLYPVPYTPVYVLGNHDKKRVMSRVEEEEGLAKLLAVLAFTARGVPVTYYGEEIGMVEGLPLKKGLDPIGERYAWVPGFLRKALNLYLDRDGCRTPMQWNGEVNAGFSETTGELWLPLAPQHNTRNVASMQNDPNSIFNLYKDLLRIRKSSAVLQAGSLRMLDTQGDVVGYVRSFEGEEIMILMNFSNSARMVRISLAQRETLLQIGEIVEAGEWLQVSGYGAVVSKSLE